MNFINFVLTRAALFCGVALGIWVCELVFLDGVFDRKAFWAFYLGVEGLLLGINIFAWEPRPRSSYRTSGTALNLDGTPPAHIKAEWDAQLAREAARTR